MNFMLVSKENLGCVILLLLVVVLSLSKTFNIFMDSHLGRLVLILFVLVLSYLNKILGVVGALFVIIILSGTNMLYQEGFESNDMNKGTTMVDTTKSNTSKDTQKEKEEVQKGDNTVNVPTTPNMLPTSVTTTPNTSNTSSMPQMNPPSHDASAVTSSIASATTTEGFDIIGLENDIKKGKPSNSIPVNAFMRESQFVSAYEANPFKEEFANF
jgi:hypothetical protein